MYFDSVHTLLAMEGHGIYVWSSYVVVLAVIAALLIAPVRRRKRLLRELAATLKRAQAARDNVVGGR